MSGFLALLILCYIILSICLFWDFTIKIIEDELFDEGFRVIHIVFFPSLVGSFLVVVSIMIIGIPFILLYKLLDIRLD